MKRSLLTGSHTPARVARFGRLELRLLPVMILILLLALCGLTTSVHAQATPPTITSISDQIINRGTSTVALAFSVNDAVTPAAALTVTATPRHPALLYDGTNHQTSGIVLTGPDVNGNCTVTLTPVAVYSGSTQIRLSVTNGAGLNASSDFNLTVNGPPHDFSHS